MKISEITYNLPPDRIAKYPPVIRGDAKLLVLHRETGKIEHRQYKDLAEYLDTGDLIIRNNTKVIPARLHATKENGAQIELLLLEKHLNLPYTPNSPTSEAIYRGTLHAGDTLLCHGVSLTVSNITTHGTVVIQSERNLYDLAQEHGEAPIPPYLKREATDDDKQRYQTVFAEDPGSVAAPTASLNFTDELEQQLRDKGVEIEELTLHIGRGTFLPLKTQNIEDHNMHQEYYSIPPETIIAIKNILSPNLPHPPKIVALGTTVTRALEHASPVILDLLRQSEANPDPESKTEPISAEADIFIYPGYEFKIIDALLTNFHAPKSTVLLLAATFAGKDNLLNVYNEALKNDYRFLSYGDSMLIL